MRAALVRGIGLLVFWAMLSSGNLASMPVGVVAAVAASWASLRLLPPGAGRLRPIPLAHFVLHFLWQSAIAGVDVARRALDPRLPLRTGYVTCPESLLKGPARHAFTSLMSLLPGTVPVGTDESGGLVIHCLDVGQPVAAQLAAEEALFARVIGDG